MTFSGKPLPDHRPDDDRRRGVAAGPLTPHPFNALFPADAEFVTGGASADVVQCCLRQPVILADGMILLGSGRLRAAFAMGVVPQFETYAGGEPLAYAIASLFQAPNFTAGQRAATVAYLQDWSLAQKHGGVRNQVAKLQLATCRDRALLSRACVRYQATADMVAKASMALIVKVIAGSISLEEAVKLLRPKAKGDAVPKPDPHEKCNEEIESLRAQVTSLQSLNRSLGDL